jgi:hypothetical protein
MTTIDNDFNAKLCSRFYCKCCDYRTSKKSSYQNHNESKRHKNNILTTLDNDFDAKLCPKKYSCENCDKAFNDRAGLWRHKKKCKNEESNDVLDILSDKNIILEILKNSAETQKQMLEMANKIGSTNCNNNTNSHNNTHFNLQFFLNETCKDALNLTDFVEQFKLQLSDLDMIGRVGYTEGMSKLFIKNLNELDVHKRPIHCSDLKRETLYVKDKDTWEKENSENVKLKQAIKKVEHKNIKQIPQWKEENPTAEDTETKKHMEYQNMLLEVMGGSTLEDDNKKHEKIIKNIAKEVAIEKNKT